MSMNDNNKYNILCIDDNQNNLFTLSALLKTLDNINPIECLSAKDGLDVLIKQDIDLILLDVQMPQMNGFEAAKLIKSNKKTRDIPIIFVTAVFKSEEFIHEGFEIGAVDYLTKPIDDNQLLNKISLYLKIFDQNNKLMQSEKRFYDIAQSIGDGIYTLDLNNKVTFINNEALKLLGFEAQEIMGKEIHKYIAYKDRNNHPISSKDCKIQNVAIDGCTYKNNNHHLIKKDASFLPVSIIASPLYVDAKIVGVVAIFRDKTKQYKIKALEDEKLKTQEQIIHSMIDMIEARDSYTAGHTKRVAQYCELIAIEMGYAKDDIELLKNAAWLHDIGKISTPDSVLLKPSKLSEVEYGLIKEHLESGYEMLSKIDQYKVIADIMREHHEKYNGTGYPRALKGNEILPLSRIMIVADAFDAMTTNRVYKSKKTVPIAIDELVELSSIHFHPEVVAAASVALRDIVLDSDISQLPKSSIEEQRFSYFYKDRLTNMFIIEYLSLILRYHVDSDNVYLYNIHLHNFTEYNKRFSWAKGDEFLIEFAHFIDNLYERTVVFRVEGDDFILLSQTKIDTIHDDIKGCHLIEDSIVEFSIRERYIEDIKNNEISI